ncbi:MAG TPA: phenylalanine--tRNA ligase subunit beta [Acidobacteriota bacterium]|nr:phenylalanine--tRNA ligase subunit beta [Acidobacteriota bacterium]
MVGIDISHKALQAAIGDKLTVKEIEDLLFTIGFEVDGVDGDLLKVEVTPDRLDALSTQGLARVIKAYLHKKSGQRAYETKKSTKFDVHVDPSVAQVRPYTVCAVVDGLKLNDDLLKDIIGVQEKLHASFAKQRKKAAIGIYPMEHITWPITFCAKRPADISFRPLGSASKMSASQILLEHPAGKAYAHLLSGKSHYPLFTDSKDVVLSMPPIINSEECGRVTTKTKSVFIEVSGFDQKPLAYILTLLSCIFIDMGATVHTVTVHYGKKKNITPQLASESRSISVKKVNEVTGLDITSSQLALMLEKMHHKVKSKSATAVTIEVAPFRSDIWHDVDIIDDVVRAVGINNIKPRVPTVATTGHILPQTRFIDNIRLNLVGQDMQEIMTLAVTDKVDQFEKMGVQATHQVNLGSTAERSINMLRSWLLPESLKVLANNKDAPHPIRIFEIGDVVVSDESADVRSKNVCKVCISLCSEGVTFTDIKQSVEALFAVLGFTCTFKAVEHNSFIKGRCAEVIVNNRHCGMLGEVTPSVLVNWGLEYPVATAELFVDQLFIEFKKR